MRGSIEYLDRGCGSGDGAGFARWDGLLIKSNVDMTSYMQAPPAKRTMVGVPLSGRHVINIIASLLSPAAKQLRTLLLIYKAFRLLASAI